MSAHRPDLEDTLEQLEHSRELFEEILLWLQVERTCARKVSLAENDRATPALGSLAAGSFWQEQFQERFGQVEASSLSKAAGKRAVADLATLALSYLESVVRVHGALPPPRNK